jgi:TRAP-type transport system periplasmic protein
MTLLKQPTEISVESIDRFVALSSKYSAPKTKVGVGRGFFLFRAPMLLKTIIAIAIAGYLTLAAARADEPVTLRFAIPGSSPQSSTYTTVFQPWMAKVEADSAGQLKLQPFFTIANFGNVYERVTADAADVGYAVEGSIGGKFVRSSVVELPSDIISGKAAAGAFWKIYEDGLIASEYQEVRPLALFVFPQNILNSWKPLATLSDLKGLRVATLSGGAAKIADKLGAAPISTSPPNLFEMMQHRTADAVIIGWLGLSVFHLGELMHNHLALGMDSGGGLVMINKEVYAELPPEAKAALDRNTGLAASLMMGAAIEQTDGNAQKSFRALNDQNIVTPSVEDRARYAREVSDVLAREWAEKTPNGAAILAAYRAEAERLQNQH